MIKVWETDIFNNQRSNYRIELGLYKLLDNDASVHCHIFWFNSHNVVEVAEVQSFIFNSKVLTKVLYCNGLDDMLT